MSLWPSIHDSAFVDPTAFLCGRVVFQEDVFIGPCAVIRADDVGSNGHTEAIVIAAHSNTQDGVVVHAKSGAFRNPWCDWRSGGGGCSLFSGPIL